MGPIIAFVLIAQTAGDPAELCTTARHQYEALAFEEALHTADSGLQAAPGAVNCLEVRALVLLASGRTEAAAEVLATLFGVSPDHVVDDRSLAPRTRALIARVRSQVQPLTASVAATWVNERSLRIEMGLGGGLRGAQRIRYKFRLGPADLRGDGELGLVGSVGTATVSVPVAQDARTLEVLGEVLDESGVRVTTFSSQVLLPLRDAPHPNVAAVEPAAEGLAWWVWAGISAVVLGSAAALTLVAQPELPDAGGTLGRVKL